MRLTTLLPLALAAASAVTSRAECPVCPNGLSVPDETVIGRQGGQTFTCGGLLVDALAQEANSDVCASMLRSADRVCCPAGGAEAEDQDGAAPGLEEEEGEPEQPAASCPVCPTGLTVDGGTIIPSNQGRGLTCDDLLGFASNTPEASPVCAQMLRDQSICCPAEGAGEATEDEEAGGADGLAENPCPVCAGGISAPEDTVIGRQGGRTLTCGTLVEDALGVEEGSDVCTSMFNAERVCCPPKEDEGVENGGEGEEGDAAVNPCPVCTNGTSVPDDTVLNQSGGQTFTCGGLIVDALQQEDGTQICDAMQGWERVCCPTDREDGDEPGAAPVEDEGDGAVENPCPVCTNGTSVPDDTVLNQLGGRTFTCGGLIDDALQQEEGTPICDAMQGWERVCCPPAEEMDGIDEEEDDEDEEEEQEVDEKEEQEGEEIDLDLTSAPSLAPQKVSTPTPFKEATSSPVESLEPTYDIELDLNSTSAPSPAPQKVSTPAPFKETTSSPVESQETMTPPDDVEVDINILDPYEPSPAPTEGRSPTVKPTTGAPFRAFGRPKPPTPGPVASPNGETESPSGSPEGFVPLAFLGATPVPTEETNGPTRSPVGALVGGLPASEPAFVDVASSAAGVQFAFVGIILAVAISVMPVLSCI